MTMVREGWRGSGPKPYGRVTCDYNRFTLVLTTVPPPTDSLGSSLKMTRCRSESRHDSLALGEMSHVEVLTQREGEDVVGELMEFCSSAWMEFGFVSGQCVLQLMAFKVLVPQTRESW
ncbi:hypothetical protein NFI96_024903, partial [Prochilodus magdalenae]